MKKLETANYLKKRIVNFLFNEKGYNRIKLMKIILDYKLGRRYEMSPILKYFVNKDSIVLDIGANMGQYACRLNEIVKKGKGQIHSFEPVSFNFIALKEMKSKLKLEKVILNKTGVGKDIRNAEIKIPFFENGLIVGTRATMSKLDDIKYKTETIQIISIDAYFLQYKIKNVDFIKCDTEGNESNVLKGGINTITSFLPTLSFEISYNDPNIKWLDGLGYRMYYYDSKIRLLNKVSDEQKGNLILIHESNIEKFKKIIK